ncbi:MAG TPA: serine/threonine-protein kinase [Gemmataceae bacterium]|jgi:serine/threonine protein kinase|nr:serine/threonine-protein kinase [Gemmataceae bacterium]
MTTLVERDDRLANLLADLAEQQRRGTAPDIEAAARAHPDLADELRELWATAQFAAAFVSPAAIPTLPQTTAEPVPPPDSFGDYEILEELGRGGMGVVYRARQKSLDRMVAIKMMREARLSNDSDRGRFTAEAEAAARLKHPSIVTVYEVGQQAGLPYIVMEYVEGRTLAQALAGGPLPPRDAARLVAEIARGVHHAHERGILHRDLKPGNILLSAERGLRSLEFKTDSQSAFRAPHSALVPKVADFGLAKRMAVSPESVRDWRTQTGAIVGTPGYMAPEQATGRKDVTPATDVYALGAILYECLTGRPPFQATNPIDILFMVVEQEPVSPRLLVSGIDRDLEMICIKCLQKPPELRYASAAELAADLEAYLAGEAVSSQPSGLTYFFSRMMRETHHAVVLENWGLLWIFHSLATFVLCLLTQVMAWSEIRSHTAYLTLWSVGLVTWGFVLWQLRRRAGPVLFVERQIAHAWAAGVCASISMFVIEVLMDLPVLYLSPALAVSAGMVFVFKAGILSGRFYVTAIAMFLTAGLMAVVPKVGVLLFGAMTALSFLVPGIKYYRIRRRAEAGNGTA